jgi:hypothetical protein
MAYGLAYFGEFYDLDGRPNRVEIRDLNKPDDTNPHRMTMMRDKPISWTLPDQSRFGTIYSRGLSIHVSNSITEGPLFYQPMFGGPETDFRFDLYQDSLLIFQGFVIPALYQDYIGPFPHAIEISANDRLKSLVNIDYAGPPDSESSLLSLITILDDCLKLTGLDLPIEISCGIFAEYHLQAASDTLFDQTYVDQGILLTTNGDLRNAMDIIADLMKSFVLRIRQERSQDDGALVWKIERISDLDDASKNWVRYVNAVKTTFFSVAPTTITFGNDPGQLPELKDENGLTYQSGYKTIELTLQLQKVDNLLFIPPIFNTIGAFEQAPGVSQPGLQALRKRWFRNSNVNIIETPFSEAALGIQGTSDYPSGNVPETTAEFDGAWTTVPMSYTNSGEVLNINIEATFDEDSLFKGQNIDCVVEVYAYQRDSGQEGYIIQTIDNGTELNDWRLITNPDAITDPGDTPQQVADSYARIIKWHVFDDDQTDYSLVDNRTHNFDIPIPLFKVFGNEYRDWDIGVKIIPFRRGASLVNNALTGSVVIENVVAMTPIVTVTSVEMENVWEATIQENFIEKYTDEVVFTETVNQNYKNALLYPAGDRIQGWAYLNDDEDPYDPLVQLYFEDLYRAFQTARFAYVTAVRSGVLPLSNFYFEGQFTNKTYFVTGYKHNFHRAVGELTLAEFVDSSEDIELETDYNVFDENRIGKNGELSNGNLQWSWPVDDASDGHGTTAGTIPKNSNKWYCEFEIITLEPGYTTSVGVGTPQSYLNPLSPTGEDNIMGTDEYSLGYWSNGSVYQNGILLDTLATYTVGDIISVAADLSQKAKTITFFKNGIFAGIVNITFFDDTRWSPCVGQTGGTPAGPGITYLSTQLNSGATPFAYTPGLIHFHRGWFANIFDFTIG